MPSTDLAFKLWTRLRDIARAARRDRDARNTRFRVEHTQHKGQICTVCDGAKNKSRGEL